MMKTCLFIIYITLSLILSLIGHVSANEISAELDCIVYGNLDYLLWFTNEDEFRSPTVATGKSPNLSSKWSPGIRAMIGGESSCWNTELCYTYYSTRSQGQSNANIETILASTPTTAGIFEVGKKWRLHFNRIDWQLSRKIFFCDHFALEPFFGLSGLDVSQEFDTNVDTVFLDLATDFPATQVVNAINRNSLLAIGTQTGIKYKFEFTCGFGFFGNFGANFLWGRFKIKQDYQETNYYSSNDSSVLVDQSKHTYQNGTVFNADVGIGFYWRYLFQQSNLELVLKVGWEQHLFVDIIRFRDFYLQQSSLGSAVYTTNGNISLSGLSFGVLLIY